MQAATLTLQDIANLANVRRPVVSMWRKRPRGANGVTPFPPAVRTVDGVEHFDRDAVTDYLRRTGRGNNSEFDLDAPAGTVPDDAAFEELVTLLCLRVAVGDELTSASEKEQMAAAYTVDPGDRFLVREVRNMRSAPSALEYIDDLFAMSRGPGDALERLEQSRVARRQATRGLSADCVALVASIATACATQISDDVVPLAYAGGDSDLAMRVARGFATIYVPDDEPDVRRLRQQAFICGIEQTTINRGPAVKLASVVGKAQADALALLDELVLGLAQGQAAVVIGAASTLTDRLNGDVEQQRTATLRSRSLACALRLPRGLWRSAHRQSLGIWVCLRGADVTRPMVVDLEAFPNDEIDRDDLSSDIAGCLGAALTGGLAENHPNPLRVTKNRAFRYLRPRRLSDMDGRWPVVPRGIRAERLGTSATEFRDRIIEQTLVTSVPSPPFDVAVADAPSTIVVWPRSLGDLADEGLVLRRGSRFDPTEGDPAGTVEVWRSEGPTGLRYDPIEAERRHPQAQRTEPGDVVFDVKPRPHATVDARGGALVASPSRILRLADTTPLGPYTLAAVINLLPAGLGDWQSWPVPRLQPGQADALEAALRRAATYEHQLRRRLDAAWCLQQELIAGVAAGAITIEPEVTSQRNTHIEENADAAAR